MQLRALGLFSKIFQEKKKENIFVKICDVMEEQAFPSACFSNLFARKLIESQKNKFQKQKN